MKRLHILLLSAHLFLIGGAVFIYVSPSYYAVGMILAGWFIRKMVPFEHSPESVTKAEETFRGVISGILILWLLKVGLIELLHKALEARMDFLPILAGVLFLSYLTLSDWKKFLRLTESEIEAFYQKS